MRIISGKYKRRVLKSLQGVNTRPTLDRIKENMFNLIGGNCYGIGLDLFSGSGNLGIEALSRGLDKVYLVDNNKQAIDIIKANVKNLNIEQNCEIRFANYQKAVDELIEKEINLDFIFLDPPYSFEKYDSLILQLTNQLLNNHGMIIVETHKNVELNEHYDKLFLHKKQNYGIANIYIYKKQTEFVFQEEASLFYKRSEHNG